MKSPRAKLRPLAHPNDPCSVHSLRRVFVVFGSSLWAFLVFQLISSLYLATIAAAELQLPLAGIVAAHIFLCLVFDVSIYMMNKGLRNTDFISGVFVVGLVTIAPAFVIFFVGRIGEIIGRI